MISELNWKLSKARIVEKLNRAENIHSIQATSWKNLIDVKETAAVASHPIVDLSAPVKAAQRMIVRLTQWTWFHQ